MPAKNPFTASFGTSPPVLVGRDDVLEGVRNESVTTDR